MPKHPHFKLFHLKNTSEQFIIRTEATKDWRCPSCHGNLQYAINMAISWWYRKQPLLFFVIIYVCKCCENYKYKRQYFQSIHTNSSFLFPGGQSQTIPTYAFNLTNDSLAYIRQTYNTRSKYNQQYENVKTIKSKQNNAI